MKFIVTPVGLEPTTYGLEGHCFYPIELRGYLSLIYSQLLGLHIVPTELNRVGQLIQSWNGFMQTDPSQSNPLCCAGITGICIGCSSFSTSNSASLSFDSFM